jgi:hypothetical protein
MHRYRVMPGEDAQIAARDTRDPHGFSGDKLAGRKARPAGRP